MIYLITGVPGSGKTLYAVSTLLPKLGGEVYTRDDGSELRRRLVVDGIPNLALDHALMAESVTGEKGSISTEGHGFANWHEWCQAGDVLVVDEVQRYARPRSMGTTPPDCIKMLETHRHKGVDFVFITQQPPLMDQNIRRLVGRHLHVRRLFGMSRAVIYEWDGCQVDTHRVAGATKSLWSYPRRAFDQYKSSELHTKQRHRIPAWLAVPVLALVGGVFVAPLAWDAISAKKAQELAIAAPKPAAAKSPADHAAAAKPASQSASVDLSKPEAVAVAQPLQAGYKMPMPDQPPTKALGGCLFMHGRCECFDTDLLRVQVPDGFCEVSSHRVGQIPQQRGTGISAPGGAVARSQAPTPAPSPAAAPAPVPAPAVTPPPAPAVSAALDRIAGRFMRPGAEERLPPDPRELEMLEAGRPPAPVAEARAASLSGFVTR